MGAGHAWYEKTRATVRLEHGVGPDDGCEAAGDLAHRSEQGQRTGGQLYRLIGDGGDTRGKQRIGERAVGGEVQVGEQHEIAAQVAVLAGDGLFDLEQQVGEGPGLGGVGADYGASLCVFGIRD